MYNSALYLNKCLDSLVDKRIIDNIEVIVVDDGSSDSSVLIAQKYVDKYPCSVKIIKKKNGGHGSVINTGSKIANGKYMKILDSDDWVQVENMEKLILELSYTDSDIVVTNFNMVDSQGKFCQKFISEHVEYNKLYTLDEFMSLPNQSRSCCTFHGVFYKTEFYKKSNIQLTENIYYEDQEYATFPFYYANSILFLDLCIYQYLVGREGQSVSHENQVKRLNQIETIMWNILNFYNKHNDMTLAKKEYFYFKISGIALSYFVAALLKNSNRNQGRRDAAKLREKIKNTDNKLYEMTTKKYNISVFLHIMHISPDLLESIKRTHLYHFLKKFI